jgi:iron complex outermembrane receptor protein
MHTRYMRTITFHIIGRLFPCTLVLLTILTGPASADESVESYLSLDLKDLLSIEITSVSRKKERLSEAAAAVFVITQEDIRRTGVTTIPEALRMAPGLQVAKLDSNKWAISSRGFNAQFANKLLVLIDGRTVYTPAYSGVYWEVQDTLLEDIDRIEVIRGPGATLWGANAVNGVINIITKKAVDTQGGLLVVGAGNEEKGFTHLRYGGKLSEGTYGRGYIKYNKRDSSFAPTLDRDAGDEWQVLRGGFRVDGTVSSDQWTLQGDVYDADENQIVRSVFRDPSDPANNPPDPASPYSELNVPDNFDASGWNLLGRWDRQLAERSHAMLQVYYDHNERKEEILGQTHDTLDIEFQHQFRPLARHDIVWGLGYRRIEDEFDNTFGVSLLPSTRTINLTSAFIQDEIDIAPETLRLTLGSKFEHNDYTGLEILPSVRLLWLPRPGHTLWTSISRAVRTPSRVERSSRIVASVIPAMPPAPPGTPPAILAILGSEDFDSEDLTAIELGYRVQPADALSLDLALFYNEYKNLQTFEQLSFVDFNFDSKGDSTSRGLELAMDWRVREWWRLQANYSFLDISANIASDSNDQFSAAVVEGSSPRHQFYVRSIMDLASDWSLDVWVNYVDDLSATSFSLEPVDIPGYTSVNLRLAWQPKKDVELSLVANNLLDERHAEFAGENFITPTEVERSVYGQIRWDF